MYNCQSAVLIGRRYYFVNYFGFSDVEYHTERSYNRWLHYAHTSPKSASAAKSTASEKE